VNERIASSRHIFADFAPPGGDRGHLNHAKSPEFSLLEFGMTILPFTSSQQHTAACPQGAPPHSEIAEPEERMKTKTLRAITASVLFASFALVGTIAGTAQAQPEPAPKPCTTKKFEFSEVEKACSEGGQPAAKAMMKKAVKKAKATGEAMNCKSCHKDTKKFELKEGAADELRKWL
jgi:hypothetical protein